MKVLVTGSSGLVGAALGGVFTKAGIDVVPFDLRHDGSDIRDQTALRRAMAGCDGVIHLAAVSRVAWGEADPALCDDVNVAGSASVIEAALGQPRRPWLIFASSREVYGCLDRLPAREDDPQRPVNAYGRSKMIGEGLVTNARTAGLRTAILRLSNVYGAVNDHPDRAVPALLWNAMTAAGLGITGADTFFDFVHVEDCAHGFLTVARILARGASLPPLHLVTGVATSLGDLAGLVLEISGSRAALSVEPARSFDVSGFVGDPALAASTIGWRSRIDLRDGVERLRQALLARKGPMDPVHMPPARPLCLQPTDTPLELRSRRG